MSCLATSANDACNPPLSSASKTWNKNFTISPKTGFTGYCHDHDGKTTMNDHGHCPLAVFPETHKRENPLKVVLLQLLHSWNVLSLLRQSVRSSAEWIIHQDHSQRVTAAVHCHLSHCKPLFIFIWAQERWTRLLQQLSWIFMFDTVGPDRKTSAVTRRGHVKS